MTTAPVHIVVIGGANVDFTVKVERLPQMGETVSPPLANMMEDPLLQERYIKHLDLCIRLSEREIERTRSWGEIPTASCYTAICSRRG